ncbi:MAG: hypothetical protein ACI8VW_001791, partial [bacterium]
LPSVACTNKHSSLLEQFGTRCTCLILFFSQCREKFGFP